jgi:hypothetical protein
VQVVHRADLERVQRVVLVGRDEHHRRNAIHLERGDDAEAVQLRHLDVDEDEVRLESRDEIERVESVAALTHELQPGRLSHQRADSLAGEGLVVHRDDTDRRH